MARMNWKLSFEFKARSISKAKLSRKQVFSTKWVSWKSNKDEKTGSPTSTPTASGAPAVSILTNIPNPLTIATGGIPRVVPTLAADKAVEEQKLSEFTCFQHLPAELRSKIWKRAAFIPRNVNIWSSDFGNKLSIPLNGNEDEEEGDVLVIWKLCSTTPNPAILSATSESRNEALKHYKLDFGTSYTFRDFTFTTHPRIYFNFDVDRLCLMESFEGETSRACKNFFDRVLTNGTKYLALNVKRFQTEPWRESLYIRPFLTRCMDKETKSSLEHIMLVSPEYNREMRGNFEFKNCVELLGAPQNINTSILQNLNTWVRDSEKTHADRDTGSQLDIAFQTLVINGHDCVD